MTEAPAAPSADDYVPPRFWWFKRLGITAAVLALLGMVGHWVANAVTQHRLQSLVDSYRSAGQPVYPEDFAPPHQDSREENAANLLVAAEAASTFAPRGVFSIGDYRLPDLQRVAADAAEIDQVLANNAKALDCIRRRRSLPVADWCIPIESPVYDTLWPARSLVSREKIGRLVAVAALHAEATGRSDEALERIADGLALADHVGHMHGTPYGYYSARSMGGLIVHTINEILPTLRVAAEQIHRGEPGSAAPEQVRAVVRRLLDESGIGVGWARSAYIKRCLVWDTIDLLCRGDMTIGSVVVGAPGKADGLIRHLVAPAWRIDAHRTLVELTEFAEAGACDTYPQSLSVRRCGERRDRGALGVVTHPSTTLVRSQRHAVRFYYAHRAARRMAAVALAIRWYDAEHGRLPERLDDLIPRYIDSVPPDPLAVNSKVCYAPNADPPVLTCAFDEASLTADAWSTTENIDRLPNRMILRVFPLRSQATHPQ